MCVCCVMTYTEQKNSRTPSIGTSLLRYVWQGFIALDTLPRLACIGGYLLSLWSVSPCWCINSEHLSTNKKKDLECTQSRCVRLCSVQSGYKNQMHRFYEGSKTHSHPIGSQTGHMFFAKDTDFPHMQPCLRVHEEIVIQFGYFCSDSLCTLQWKLATIRCTWCWPCLCVIDIMIITAAPREMLWMCKHCLEMANLP